MKKSMRFLSIVLAGVLSLGLVGCAGSAASDMAAPEASQSTSVTYGYSVNKSEAVYDVAEEFDTTEAAEMEPGTGAADTGNVSVPDASRKVILTADVRLEAKDYDTALAGLLSRITAAGGYIAGREDYNHGSREVYLTARIPAKQYDSFLGGLDETANVIRLTQSSEDITESYLETESYLKSLNTQQDRLLELMEKAESLEDLLAIEDRLADVRARLQYYDSLKNSYDNKVNYATVTLDLYEVRDYTITQPTFGEELLEVLRDSVRGFVNFLENALFTLITLFPYLVILVPALILIIRARKKRKAKKLAEKAAKQE